MDESQRIDFATAIQDELIEHWDGRAQSYADGVEGELSDERRSAWDSMLSEVLDSVFSEALLDDRAPHVADLGCGPGFFSVLLAQMGCEVDAIDASSEMLSFARESANKLVPGGVVAFHECDLLSLPFQDGTFDACVSRNVTWLMRDPKAAYAEWLRVLRPGGKLIAFDANWYRYLVDPAIEAQRRADQAANVLEGWDDDSQSDSDVEKRFEVMAAKLPTTPLLRPAWDIETLEGLGVTWARADEDAWKRLWTENEKAYYGSSPMFMIEAVK